MENKKDKELIGKKIEEALKQDDFADLDDLIKVPSPETFAKWVDIADEKRRKRASHRRLASVCAVLVIAVACVAVLLKTFAVPDVTADPEDGIRITSEDMESTKTYESWEDLPESIKEEFVEIENLPTGYEVERIEVKESVGITKVKCTYSGESFLEIQQISPSEGYISQTVVDKANELFDLGNKTVYVETYKDNIDRSVYKFVANENAVEIYADSNTTSEFIFTVIEEF